MSHNGERVLKASSSTQALYQNGSLLDPTSVTMDTYTMYPSAFLVINEQGIYSKHYYAGSQRIVSRIGDQDPTYFDDGCNGCKQKSGVKVDFKQLQQAQVADLNAILAKAKKGKAKFKEYKAYRLEDLEKAIADEDSDTDRPATAAALAPLAPLYFYHPDHLGTSTALTDFNGKAYQFFLNLPFGETMAEQHGTQYYQTPYKFNGKELDEETGLYYYGARYYDPKVSIWYGVDPLADKYKNWNPYNYTMENPINLVDPTGMGAEFKKDKNGNLHVEKGDNAAKLKKEYGLKVTDKNFKFKEGNVIMLNNEKSESTLDKVSKITDYAGNVGEQSAKYGSKGNIAGRTFEALVKGKTVNDGTIDGLAKIGNASEYGGIAEGVGKCALPLAVGFSAIKIGTAIKEDGNTFGPKATVATTSSAGSIGGGLAGAEGGAAVGAAIGAWFGGVGAVPGAIIGGIIGGIGGGIGGEKGGEWVGKKINERK